MTIPSTPLNRRRFMSMAALGVSMPALATFLSSCSRENQGALGGGGDAEGKVTELIVATATTPWLEPYREVVRRYEAESGVKITLRAFPFDGLLTQQVNAFQQGSKAFDVFQINEGWVGEFYGKKWVRPLTDIDPAFKWDEQLVEYDGVGRWDPKTQLTGLDGDAYGLPINGNIQVFAYRKDLYEKLGLQIPKTFNEALTIGRAAQQAGAAKYGYLTRGQGAAGGGYSVTFDFSPVLHGNGGDFFVEPGKDWTPRIDDDVAVASLEQYLRLLSLGPAQPQTVDQAQVVAAMQSGQALQGHLVAGVAPQLDDEAKSRVAGKVGYAVIPAGSAGPAPTSGTWVLGIPVGIADERAKAGLAFMQWLVSKQTMMQWAEAGGTVTRTDVLKEASGADHPELTAIRDSLQYIHGGLRFPFSTDMLNSTEVNLNQVVAGQKTPKAGLAAIAQDLRAATSKAGLT